MHTRTEDDDLKFMDNTKAFQSKPYRAAPALGQDRWSIYADDDHRQERYLGTVVEEEGKFFVNLGYKKGGPTESAESFEAAVEMIYDLCKASGYLTQGHDNYLGGQRDE